MMRVVLKDKIDRLMSGNFKSQEWYEQVVDGFPDVVEEMVVPANRALALKDREMAALLAKARSTARTAKTATMSGRVRRKKRGEGTAENSDEGDETDDVNDVGVFDDPNGDELGDDIDDIEEADFSQ
jgi:Na+/phosphate symporter